MTTHNWRSMSQFAYVQASAPKGSHTVIKAHLKRLLNALDAIAEKDDDITDTEVRELMYKAVYNGFIVQTPGYSCPSYYSLYKVDEGNDMLREALTQFVLAACKSGSATPEQRFAEFQDLAVISDGGRNYDFYFGSADSLDQLMGFEPDKKTRSE
jgi:hypothetical protein